MSLARPLLLLVLGACAVGATDEPMDPPEEATVYADGTPEGACLRAVAERAPDAGLQVTSPGATSVGVTADGEVWTCRIGDDGTVTELTAPPARR